MLGHSHNTGITSPLLYLLHCADKGSWGGGWGLGAGGWGEVVVGDYGIGFGRLGLGIGGLRNGESGEATRVSWMCQHSTMQNM